LILASSLYLVSHFDLPNLVVWLLCVAMGLSALGSNVLKLLFNGRTARVWTLTPVSWERQISKPADADEKDMPERFLRAENGDRAKAVARWRQTLEWRRQHNVDTILEMPHKKFSVIKQYYPHFFHKRTKNGLPVYFEKLGGIDIAAMEQAGITMEDLLYHYIHITEFLWEVLAPDPDAQVLTVLDCRGISLKDARGPALQFVRKASAFQQAHYPERSFKMFIINVPSWFSLVWSVVQNFVHKNTRQKIFIYSNDEYKRKLLEFIDADSLPEEYGGRCRCTDDPAGPPQCQWNSEEERRLAALVALANSEDTNGNGNSNNSADGSSPPSSPPASPRGSRAAAVAAAMLPPSTPRQRASYTSGAAAAAMLPSPSPVSPYTGRRGGEGSLSVAAPVTPRPVGSLSAVRSPR